MHGKLLLKGIFSLSRFTKKKSSCESRYKLPRAMDICLVFFISKFLRSFYFLICVIYFNEVAASHLYLNLSTYSTPVFSIFLMRSFYFLCIIHLYEVAASRFYLNLHQPAAFSAFSVAFRQLSPVATKTAKELTKPKAIQPTKLLSKPTNKPNN